MAAVCKIDCRGERTETTQLLRQETMMTWTMGGSGNKKKQTAVF